MLRQKFKDKEFIRQETLYKFWGNTTYLQFVGQNQVARTFTDSYFFGNFTGKLGDDFDESQQALSQRDRRPLTWKAVHIWGRLRWTFCPI